MRFRAIVIVGGMGTAVRTKEYSLALRGGPRQSLPGPAAVLVAAEFLSDLSLVHIAAVRRGSTRVETTVSYRELMSDHPVAPTWTMFHEPRGTRQPPLGETPQHRLHLLRLFLVGCSCPVCRNGSTLYADGVVTLKGPEHGRTVKDASIGESVRRVGPL